MRSISKLRAGTRGHTELLLHPPISEQSPSNHYSLECLWRNPPATKKKTSQKWRRWSCGHKIHLHTTKPTNVIQRLQHHQCSGSG